MNNPYQQSHPVTEGGAFGVAEASRATFLQRTYGHLLGAIVLFTLIEVALFKSGVAYDLARTMLSGHSATWLLWLGGFMLIAFIATRFADNAQSIGKQYLGLGLYVAALSIIFIPLLVVANTYAPGVIETSAIITLVGFSALTAIVFVTRKDFSFMRTILMWGTFAALGFIVVGAIAGFSGGVIFPILMIALMGGWILHDTSNILLRYPEDRYVGAALTLFASIAMMFYYVVMLFLSRD